MPKSHPIVEHCLIFSKFFNESVRQLLVLPTDHFKTACTKLRSELTDLFKRGLEQNWNDFCKWEIIRHLLWGRSKIKLKKLVTSKVSIRHGRFWAKTQNLSTQNSFGQNFWTQNPKTQFQNKTACKIMACFLKISASLVLKFQVLPFIGGWFWVSEFLLDIFEKSLVFYNSYFTLWLF